MTDPPRHAGVSRARIGQATRMSDPTSAARDDTLTTKEGARPATSADAERGVRGGSADRLDSPAEGSGGVPAAGADGSTEAREQLRVELGERSDEAGREDAGASLDQAAAIGGTDPDGPGIEGRP